MSPQRLDDPMLLRAALHSIGDAVIIHDETTVLYANPAALRLLRAPSAVDVLGHPVLELVHPDARQGMAERLRVVMENSTSVGGFVEKLQTFDGEPIYAEINGSLVEGEDGNRAVMVVARQVS